MKNDDEVPQSIGLAEMGILRELLIQLVREVQALSATAAEISAAVKNLR